MQKKNQLKVATGRSFGEFPGNQPPSTANIVGYQLHTNKVVQTFAAERPRKWKKCDSLLKPGRLLPGFKDWRSTFNHNLWWQMDSNDDSRSKPSSILSTVYIYTCIHIYIYIYLSMWCIMMLRMMMIVLATSTQILYTYYGTHVDHWVPTWLMLFRTDGHVPTADLGVGPAINATEEPSDRTLFRWPTGTRQHVVKYHIKDVLETVMRTVLGQK